MYCIIFLRTKMKEKKKDYYEISCRNPQITCQKMNSNCKNKITSFSLFCNYTIQLNDMSLY